MVRKRFQWFAMYFLVNAHTVQYVVLQEECCPFVKFSVQNGVRGYIDEGQELNAHRRKGNLINIHKLCKQSY